MESLTDATGDFGVPKTHTRHPIAQNLQFRLQSAENVSLGPFSCEERGRLTDILRF